MKIFVWIEMKLIAWCFVSFRLRCPIIPCVLLSYWNTLRLWYSSNVMIMKCANWTPKICIVWNGKFFIERSNGSTIEFSLPKDKKGRFLPETLSLNEERIFFHCYVLGIVVDGIRRHYLLASASGWSVACSLFLLDWKLFSCPCGRPQTNISPCNNCCYCHTNRKSWLPQHH